MFNNQTMNRNILNLYWLVAEKSQCQYTPNLAIKVADTVAFAFIGAIGGALLCGVGSLISSSPLGVGAAILIGIAIGAYAGHVTGGIIGGIYGVLAAGFGSLISSTPLGIGIAILACASLAAWYTWTQRDIAVIPASKRDAKRAESHSAETRSTKMTEIQS